MDIYKYIIDKGGYFGIICVFLLFFISMYLRSINKRKENSEKLLISLLNFVRLFALITLAGIAFIYIFNAFKELNAVKSSITESTNTIPKSLKINPEKVAHTIIVNENFKIQFNRDTSFHIIKSEVSSSTGAMKIDTVYNSDINNIKQITINSFDPHLVIQYKQHNINSSFKYDRERFNQLSTVQYLYSLNNMGFDFKIQNQFASNPVVFCLFLLVITILVLISHFFFKDGATYGQGCLALIIFMLTLLFLNILLYT